MLQWNFQHSPTSLTGLLLLRHQEVAAAAGHEVGEHAADVGELEVEEGVATQHEVVRGQGVRHKVLLREHPALVMEPPPVGLD